MVHLQFISKFFRQFSLQIKENIRISKKANVFMRQVEPYIMWKSWFQACTSGLSQLGIFTLVGLSTPTIISSITQKKDFTLSFFLVMLVVYAIYQFGRLISRLVERYKQVSFREKTELLFSEQVLKKAISLDMGRLTDPQFQSTARHAGRSRVIINIFNAQTRILSAFVGVGVSFAVVLYFNPIALFVGAIPFIPETIKLLVFNKKRRAQRDELDFLNRKSNSYFRELKNPKELMQAKLFKFVPFLYKKYIEIATIKKDEAIKLSNLESNVDVYIGVLTKILECWLLWYLGRGCMNGTLSFAKLLVLLGCLRTFGDSILNLSHQFVELQEDCKDYLEFETYMATEPLVDESKSKPIELLDIPTLRVENVEFYYPRKQERVVLKNCSLVIYPGEKIAIVGSNGSGKTTLLRLLSKVYLPVEGRICINETSIEDITQESWFNHMVCITQGAEVSSLPLKEALTGSVKPDMDRLIKSAKLAGSHEMIMGRESGYDLKIREFWEKDYEEFSGGQYQRLALTTMFYRLLDEKVFVGFFDEPMSHCDIETRENFYKAINSISNKTIVAVAHDHHYLHHFERVVEIKNGCVAKDLRDAQSIREYEENVSQHENVEMDVD